ncbi:phBC6A51 family helix-turn-helix protein [Oceanobacillus sp. FSL K6-2867]|uniref:phBC6A51 family helix-turn-helix protein n=1 Tax=Oceanobacillus sp. FSL K6-2867 TaxID=2954748 RepID=UPI0030D7DDDB
MLTDKKLKAIEMISSGEYTVTAIAEELGVSRGAIYKWMKDPKFKAKLEEMNKLRDAYLKQELKDKAGKYLKELEKLGMKSKNDMVRMRAIQDLLAHADWNQQTEITINTNDDNKNDLLALWKEKQSQDKEDNNNEADEVKDAE